MASRLVITPAETDPLPPPTPDQAYVCVSAIVSVSSEKHPFLKNKNFSHGGHSVLETMKLDEDVVVRHDNITKSTIC